MMDENAQKLIVLATIITLGSTGAAYFKPVPYKLPINPKRAFLGGFAAMFISAILADFDSRLGVLLAWLVAGGAFIGYGLPFIQTYSESETPKQKQEKITKEVRLKKQQERDPRLKGLTGEYKP